MLDKNEWIRPWAGSDDKLKATDAYDINAIPREMTNVGNT